MKNDIFATLRNLKQIAPDSAYAKHSRMLILASPRHAMNKSPRVSTFFRISAMLGAGVIALFMILGGTTYINETYSPLALEGLNQKSLTAEADEINDSIEITLGSIDYLDNSNQTTLRKIAEISKTSSAEPAATTMMTAASAPTATTTDMKAFLIKSDSTAEPTLAKPVDINTILEKVSK